MVETDGSFVHEPLVERPTTGRVFTTSRRVRMTDTTVRGRLRLDGAVRYLQDIANDDSRDADSPNPTAWVARRTVLEVRRPSRYLDVVSLSTWCSGLGSRWAERRYSITAAPGGEGGDGDIQASTLWVHIDMATMRPIRLPDGFGAQFGAAASGRSVSARLHLPTRPPADSAAADHRWPLRAVDFDVLGHVNNSVYWAIVEEQVHRQRTVRAPFTVTLEHHDAIDPGDDVTVTVLETDGVGGPGFDLWVTAARVETSDGPTGGAMVGDRKVTAVVRATSARAVG